VVCVLATTEWQQKRIQSPERRAKYVSMGIHMICIDAKYTTTLYWIQRVDIVVCVLDTVKTALNSNVCNYCTVVCNSCYE
jgi:hypothetical protein